MLRRVYIKDFRSFHELEFEPYEGFTLLCGPNGSGKSNLLEAIYYLGTGDSYRHVTDDNLVRWEAECFVLKGEVRQGARSEFTKTIEWVYRKEPRRKIYRVNGKLQLPGKGSWHLPVVVFSPQDLLIVQGQPALRRRFVDALAAQVWPHHAEDLICYRGVLAQRNSLLKRGEFSEDQMQPWDDQLVAVGARIMRRRLSVLAGLSGGCRDAFLTLGGSGELSIAYFSGSDVVSGEGLEADEETCRGILMRALEMSRSLEERLRFTVVGPHRHDVRFIVNGRDARLFSSQGEQRLIALSLKIAQSRLLTEEGRLEPLLLLDDVFSELDERRRALVLGFCRSFRQVIAAVTEHSGDFVEKRAVTESISSIFVKSL
ncbi:MAG: DNA replication/repair protein RecF [Thermacetogeniaceae bacterium]